MAHRTSRPRGLARAFVLVIALTAATLPAMGSAVAWEPAQTKDRTVAREGFGGSKPVPDAFRVHEPKVASLSNGPDCAGEDHVALTEGVLQPGSLAAGELDCYSFQTEPADTFLVVSLLGPPSAEADLDLYVRFGTPASGTGWDCRPFTGSSDEECRFDKPKTGTWFVMVHAFGEGGDYNVSAGSSLCPVLGPGVVREGQSQQQGDLVCFQVDVPAGSPALVVSLDGPSNSDHDLLLRYGQPVEFNQPVNCYSGGYTNNEVCRVADPAPGSWFVAVWAYWNYGPFTLLAELPDSLCQELELGVETTISVSEFCYAFEVADADLLRMSISHGGADFDFALSRSLSVITHCWSYTWPGQLPGHCSVPGPEDGTWYLLLLFYSSGPDAAPIATVETSDAEPASVLYGGSLGGRNDGVMVRFDDPGSFASVQLLTTVDYDLLVRRGAPPTWSAYDCLGFSSTGVEHCFSSGTGPVYAYVVAWANAAAQFSVSAAGPLI